LDLGWLWQKVKLLITGTFLALAMALAFIDSKGLFGFGHDLGRINPCVFSSLLKIGGFAAGGPKFACFPFS
jgi:hypothetical protein